MNLSLLDQIGHLLRPIKTRMANMVARAVINNVDDTKKMQLLQLGVLSGEDVEDGEHFHPYGFTSVPLTGAEAIVLFPNGDRAHPIVISVADRRHRPTGMQPGEVVIHNHNGANVKITVNGDIEAVPATGREVRIGSASATDPVALKSDLTALKTYLDGHTHGGVSTGMGTSGGPSSSSPTPAASTKVKAV